jgi:3-oxoacyl-(acyl-carrier-protein) synthase
MASRDRSEIVRPGFHRLPRDEFLPLKQTAARLLNQRPPVDRAAILAIAVGEQVLREARLAITEENAPAVGLVVGVGLGTYEIIAEYYAGVLEDGFSYGSPALFVSTVANAVAGWTSIALGLKGYNLTVAHGELSGACAVGAAAAALEEGHAEAVLVVGTSTFGPLTAGSLFPRPGPDAGYVETAAAVFLETEDAARRRGVAPAGRLEAFRQETVPEGTAAGARIEYARTLCREGGVPEDRLDLILTAGTPDVWPGVFPSARVEAPRGRIGDSFSAWGPRALGMALAGEHAVGPTGAFLIDCPADGGGASWAGIIAARAQDGGR